ncbi:MAG: NAD-binding protein [Oligoflexia bacterium]|nr:NAD-binding protein [Oligoflexia bacterium]
MKSWARALLDLYRSLWERFLNTLNRRPLLTFSFIILCIICLAAALLSESEGIGASAFWHALVYMLSGLDVDPPQTITGEIVASAVLVCGVILVSLFTGYVAAEFSRLLTSAVSIPLKPSNRKFQDHTVIFGWGPKTKAVLRELNADHAARGFRADDILVVSPQEHLERGTEQIYEHVWHVRGNPNDTDVLTSCNISATTGCSGADIAVVIGDTHLPPEEADRQSLLTLLAVEHLQPKVVSLVDVFDERSAEHFRNANADEVLAPSRYATLLLARAAEFPGLSAYIDELLALAPTTQSTIASSELVEAKEPISFYVRSAEHLGVAGQRLDDAIVSSNKRSDIVVVGLLGRQGVAFTCDESARATVLEPNDQLVVIATPSQL